MKADFKAGEVVAIDPYNKLKNDPEVYSSLTGVVLEKHRGKSNVLSMQTLSILDIPNKYLYSINDFDSSNVTIARSCNPVFTIEELHLLRGLKESNDLCIKESQVLDHIITKIESNLLTREIELVLDSKESKIDYPKVNTIMQYNIKEDTSENLRDSIKMGIHLCSISNILENMVYNIHYEKTINNCKALIQDMFDKFGESLDTAKLIADTIIESAIEEDAISDIVIDNIIMVYSYLEKLNKETDSDDTKNFIDYILNKKEIPFPIKMKLGTIIATDQFKNYDDEDEYYNEEEYY